MAVLNKEQFHKGPFKWAKSSQNCFVAVLTLATLGNISYIVWKRINHKQSAIWQHLSRLKASAFLFENVLVRC